MAAGGTDGKIRFRDQEVIHPFTHNFNSSCRRVVAWRFKKLIKFE